MQVSHIIETSDETETFNFDYGNRGQGSEDYGTHYGKASL